MLGVGTGGQEMQIWNASKKLDSLTFTAEILTQSINRLTFALEDFLVLILYFVTNLKKLMNAEFTILYFNHSIITLFLQRSVLICPFPKIIVHKFETTIIPMLVKYKNPYLFLIGKKLLKTNHSMRKLALKCSSRDSLRITKKIKFKLKNRSKIIKEYYRKIMIQPFLLN